MKSATSGSSFCSRANGLLCFGIVTITVVLAVLPVLWEVSVSVTLYFPGAVVFSFVAVMSVISWVVFVGTSMVCFARLMNGGPSSVTVYVSVTPLFVTVPDSILDSLIVSSRAVIVASPMFVMVRVALA